MALVIERDHIAALDIRTDFSIHGISVLTYSGFVKYISAFLRGAGEDIGRRVT